MRPTLTVRDDGVERLIANIPTDTPAERDQMRRLARALTRAVSVWEIERAKARSRDRTTNRNGGHRHG